MADLIEIRISGLKGLQRNIAEFQKLLDPDAIVDAAGAILLNRIRTRFLDEEDTEGVKWVRSQAAIDGTGRGRRGLSNATLFDTGALFQSIQLFKRGTGVRAIGTDVPYAPFHQEGIGQVKREFLGFSMEDERIVIALVERRIAGAFSG